MDGAVIFFLFILNDKKTNCPQLARVKGLCVFARLARVFFFLQILSL
jgi:hypothetical protein